MKALIVVALIVAAVFVWKHHTVTDTKACVQTPAQVCIDRPTSTRHR